MRRPGLQLCLLPSAQNTFTVTEPLAAAVSVILSLSIMCLSDVTVKATRKAKAYIGSLLCVNRSRASCSPLQEDCGSFAQEATDLVEDQFGYPDSLKRLGCVSITPRIALKLNMSIINW